MPPNQLFSQLGDPTCFSQNIKQEVQEEEEEGLDEEMMTVGLGRWREMEGSGEERDSTEKEEVTNISLKTQGNVTDVTITTTCAPA